jgi:hypothetical protein
MNMNGCGGASDSGAMAPTSERFRGFHFLARTQRKLCKFSARSIILDALIKTQRAMLLRKLC